MPFACAIHVSNTAQPEIPLNLVHLCSIQPRPIHITGNITDGLVMHPLKTDSIHEFIEQKLMSCKTDWNWQLGVKCHDTSRMMHFL
jgi:hypothetical protein